MSKDVIKFIPPDMRLGMAQDIIDERGIRPLARELGVNPKSVFKYKKGSAHPGDDVMVKLLALFRRDREGLLEDYLSDLKDNFLKSLEEPVEVENILGGKDRNLEDGSGSKGEESIDSVGPEETDASSKGVGDESSEEDVSEGQSSVGQGETTGPSEDGKSEIDTDDTIEKGGSEGGSGGIGGSGETGVDHGVTEQESEGVSVDQRETKESKESEGVDREETEEMYVEEVCETIGVSNPFDMAKVEKIIKSLAEEESLSYEEIINWTELSEDAVEKYLDELESEGIVLKKNSGVYNLNIRIRRD